jgi:chromate transporter
MLLLWQIFLLFTRVAMFSWGGGPASLALMQRETTNATWTPPNQTEPTPWITPDEFADAVAIGNAIPGPIAPQVSAYVGYKLAGVPGAIAAAVGTVIPTTLLMLVLIVLFFGIKDSLAVKAMLTAVRPVVVGLLLWTAYDMANTVFGAKKLGWSQALTQGWDKLFFVAGAFILLTFTKINPAIIILVTAVLGFLFYHR